MIEIVKVTEVSSLDGYRLAVTFSDGSRGVEDLSDFVAEGGEMVEPLRDFSFFKQVFVSFGVPSWPNGLDLDAIALHDKLRAAKRLTFPAAAE